MTTTLHNVNLTSHYQNQKLIFKKKSFGYRGALVWNNVLSEIKNSDSIIIFKRKIKKIKKIKKISYLISYLYVINILIDARVQIIYNYNLRGLLEEHYICFAFFLVFIII